jgi:hypothetical protein
MFKLLLKFQRSSNDFSGFPTGSGVFYLPGNANFPANLYSPSDKRNDRFEDQILPFPRLGY